MIFKCRVSKNEFQTQTGVGLGKIKISISYGKANSPWQFRAKFNATHATAIFIKPGSIRLTGRFKVSLVASGRSSRSNIHEREIRREGWQIGG